MRPLTTASSTSLVSVLLATAALLPSRSADAHGHGHHHHHHNHDDHDDHRRLQRQNMRGGGGGLDGRDNIWMDPNFDDPSTTFWLGDHPFASREEFERSGARCAQPEPNEDEKALAADVYKRWRTRQGLRPGQFADLASLKETPIVVPTYAHVVRSDSGTNDVVDADITNSMRELNLAYGGAYDFQLLATTRNDNTAWQVASPFSADELDMKSTLRVGGPDALNIYFTKPGGGLLGWATFPQWYDMYEDGPESDGVVVLYSTVPGGSAYPYDEGDTLVHEVGHWLGLYHTFHWDDSVEDGCTQSSSISGQGDWVDDTPAQKEPTFGCPSTPPDTCPNEPGTDAVDNYMNYSDDACMFKFTVMQYERMAAMWDEYRKPEGSNPSPPPPSPPPPPTPTPPPNSALNPLHVINIAATTRDCSTGKCWLSRVAVTVEGEDVKTGLKDADVAVGVRVEGTYQGSSHNSRVECVTDEFGECSMRAFENPGGGGRVKFTVEVLEKTDTTYASAQNEVTTLNILKPRDR